MSNRENWVRLAEDNELGDRFGLQLHKAHLPLMTKISASYAVLATMFYVMFGEDNASE